MPSANADCAPAHALSPLPHHPVKARAEEEAAEAAAPEVVSTGNALVDALLVRSADNKALNDKKRLATSYANLARSRTVTDGTCAFPDNLIGCENKVRRTPYTATQSKWTHLIVGYAPARSLLDVWHASALRAPLFSYITPSCADPAVADTIARPPQAEMGGVKWISDDLALECEGVPEGELCASKAKGSFPSFLGV